MSGIEKRRVEERGAEQSREEGTRDEGRSEDERREEEKEQRRKRSVLTLMSVNQLPSTHKVGSSVGNKEIAELGGDVREVESREYRAM